MEPTLQPFVYHPLGPGQIRLLEHNVKDSGGDSSWILRVVTLDEAGQGLPSDGFDALSYTWGSLSETFSLRVNGQEMKIHRNLHLALPYLCRRPSPRPLWVDAVCINQNDDEEKMAQIRRMSAIYRHATQVWVWLGAGLNHTAEAIETLPLMAQVGKRSTQTATSPVDEGIMPEAPELPSPSSPIWDSILDIISNGWFGRVWIVQESALARDLRFLVGTNEVDGEMLHAVVTTASLLAERFYHVSMWDKARKFHDTQRSQAVFGIRDLVQKSFLETSNPGQPRAPKQLVWIIYQMTQNMQCSEPRDRVYGSLGLIPDDQRELLGSFSNTASLAELYANFGQRGLTQPNPVAPMWFALLHRSTMPGKIDNLPSWCPDFHQSSETVVWYEDGVTLGLDPRRAFQASSKEIVARPGETIRELVSRGCFVDDITYIYERIPIAVDFLRRENNKTDFLDAYSHLRSFERRIAQSWLSPRAFEATESLKPLTEVEETDAARIASLWKALFSGFCQFRGSQVTLETYYALRRGLDEIAAASDRTSREYDEVFSSLINNDLFQKGFYYAMYAILHRNVFVTSLGRLGLGGRSMDVGDKVFLFNGGQMPHVVRHQPADKYSLVCEAYLSDAMYGELDNLNLPEVGIVLV
ncbi:Heterokaryon incompatibility [Fusarium albosuccineum]|uniref:Heterokaryon incompatibility n=1 Tax=Fusarium albosuccineum TaxID=1237068 RepID=A0A8H4PGY8_9HYPO|nr:Heterokaryon incompatibility [Fusarium albosuccineum]